MNGNTWFVVSYERGAVSYERGTISHERGTPVQAPAVLSVDSSQGDTPGPWHQMVNLGGGGTDIGKAPYNTTSGRDCVKSLWICLHGTCPQSPRTLMLWSLSLTLTDTRVYGPQIRARLGTTV